MKRVCQKCGSHNRIADHVVETCGVCGQEKHDYETLDNLKRKLAMYEVAYRRLNAALEPEPAGQAAASHDGWLVKVSAVKEAMLLEPELFPIGGGS